MGLHLTGMVGEPGILNSFGIVFHDERGFLK